MGKSANTLNVGDNIYHPLDIVIVSHEVLEIVKTTKGIKVKCSNWSYELRKCKDNSAISNLIKYDNGHILYINKEEAIIKQKELQKETLLNLQLKVDKVLKELNDFTNKYFI